MFASAGRLALFGFALGAVAACGGRLDTDPFEGPDALTPATNDCDSPLLTQTTYLTSTACDNQATWTCGGLDGAAPTTYTAECGCGANEPSTCKCTDGASGEVTQAPFGPCATCPDFATMADACGFPHR